MSWCIIDCIFDPPSVGSVVEPSVERLEVDGAGPSRSVGNLKLARALTAPVAGCTFDFSAAGLGSDVERFLLVFAEGTLKVVEVPIPHTVADREKESRRGGDETNMHL